ncbi:spore coat protein U domain-containing protein [Sphingomonas abietis]|uniref:Spore coat protein U domain-containing protein n=1 Tax=Sphingomonas abietis TaxID=3012344 RepID=A0ABY7NQC5_9SPHN|nr:spore coat protein U domain-containing protein [Sphingomonas abietis]WBO23010.1 spore coat protein U domain-containing protein [Sphingomonas abietis]
MPVIVRMVVLTLAGATAGGWCATSATAETSKSFQVSAVIANGCSVTTTSSGTGTWGNIALGTVSGITTGTVQASLLSGSSAGIQIDCTPGMTANLTADTGNNAISGVRQLANGTARIPYLLYANGSSTAWTTQAVALSFPVGTSHMSVPVVAKATLSSPSTAGAYSDTVRVTLSW